MKILFDIILIVVASIIGVYFIKRGNYWLSEAKKLKKGIKK